MRPYAERKAARIERLLGRAEKARAEGEARLRAADRIASVIPLGQPILVGHHSERRHRRDLEKIRSGTTRGFAALEEAKELERRAERAESNEAISSDDPNAIAKLQAKAEEIAHGLARAREANVAIRKAARQAKKTGVPFAEVAGRALADLGVSERAATNLLEADFAGRIGIPAYRLQNMNAEMRRLLGRIEVLRARAARGARPDETIGQVTIGEVDNRVRVTFPGKPAEAIRREMKSHGFRWAPSEGVWQRMATEDAWYWARQIAGRCCPSCGLEVGALCSSGEEGGT